MVAALEIGGGAPEPSPAGIPDPGLLVGWALPAIAYLTQLSAVVVAGFLLAAVFLLPTSKDVVEGLSVSAVSARLALGRRLVDRQPVAVRAHGQRRVRTAADRPFVLTVHVTGVRLVARPGSARAGGRAAVVAVACRWTIGVRPLAVWLGVALAALLPVSLTGHCGLVRIARPRDDEPVPARRRRLHLGRRPGRARLGGAARQQASSGRDRAVLDSRAVGHSRSSQSPASPTRRCDSSAGATCSARRTAGWSSPRSSPSPPRGVRLAAAPPDRGQGTAS